MSPNDLQDDPLFAALRELPAQDLSPVRAQQLRRRCHRRLQTQAASRLLAPSGEPSAWSRAVRVAVAAWCLVYVLETIRHAAAVYAF
jgi:hypothetical protein